ncbi:unnamed protein product, partial [Effrenium voratum]
AQAVQELKAFLEDPQEEEEEHALQPQDAPRQDGLQPLKDAPEENTSLALVAETATDVGAPPPEEPKETPVGQDEASTVDRYEIYGFRNPDLNGIYQRSRADLICHKPTWWKGSKGSDESHFMYFCGDKERWHICPQFVGAGPKLEDLFGVTERGGDRGLAFSTEDPMIWKEFWHDDWVESDLHIGCDMGDGTFSPDKESMPHHIKVRSLPRRALAASSASGASPGTPGMPGPPGMPGTPLPAPGTPIPMTMGTVAQSAETALVQATVHRNPQEAKAARLELLRAFEESLPTQDEVYEREVSKMLLPEHLRPKPEVAWVPVYDAPSFVAAPADRYRERPGASAWDAGKGKGTALASEIAKPMSDSKPTSLLFH